MVKAAAPPKRLIGYVTSGGCSGKIPVHIISPVVTNLPRFLDQNLRVGTEHFSYADVYYLREGLAIVNTVDFFPPFVDDPFTFGQIAATNALFDIYATGGDPKMVLNIVYFPDDASRSPHAQVYL